MDLILTRITSSRRLAIANLREQEVAILLNNLGGTSQLELGIIQGEIMTWAVERGVVVKLFLHGEIMTSLDGHGVSITLLKLVDDEWLECLGNNTTHDR